MNLQEAHAIVAKRNPHTVDGILKLEMPYGLWLEIGYHVDSYGKPAREWFNGWGERELDDGEAPSVRVICIELIGHLDARMLSLSMFSEADQAVLAEVCREDCQERQK